MTERLDSDDVEAQAAQWVARLDGDCSEGDRRAFAAWLAASPAHRGAYESLRRMFADMDALSDLAIPNAAPIAPAPAGRPWYAAAAVAGGLTAAVALALAVFWPAPPEPLASAQIYAAAVGARESVALPDGSRVDLNTGSRVRVAYSQNDRVVLLEQGEAYFDVAHDANRPFEVRAGDQIVRAVGTAFAVRLNDEAAVTVTVAEGRVEVSSLGSRQRRAYLSAGEAALVRSEVKLLPVMGAPELERRLAWREGRITFSGETLDVVVAEISRYTDVRIEIADPELKSARFAGELNVGAVDGMLEALEAAGVSVHRGDDGRVLLTAADKGG